MSTEHGEIATAASDRWSLTRRTLLKGAASLPAVANATGPTIARARPAMTTTPSPPQVASDRALVSGNNVFALNLYAALRKATNGNLLLSPYSVSEALAMTRAGARGETARQMAATLALHLNQPALNAAFAALNADLVARGSGGKQGALRIADALWGEPTIPFNATYSAEIKRSFGAGLQQVDFANAPEGVRGEINAWVARQTENRIRNIVPPGAITAATRLVLANAIYFYGPWLTPFQSSATGKDTFHLPGGATASVSFMVQQEHLRYARGDGFQAVELPYEQDGFALTVLMPDEGRFDAFEAGLNAAALAAAVGQIASTEIVLHLPKFTFDFGTSLADVLATLGMPDAFDAARADFSGMITGKPPAPLWLGAVFHKAFISVDEAGTEAAAATVITSVGAAAPGPTPPPVVRIDRPFVFAIRDTTTGTLLFLGRVLDPRG